VKSAPAQTLTASLIRLVNTSAILELIRREGPISRTEIAERLQVSLPTVMRIVDDLAEEKLVKDSGKMQRSGGRRRSLLEFDSARYVVAGIDLGGTSMYGAASDLAGNFLYEASIECRNIQGQESYCCLVELIENLLAHPALGGREVRGIGIGAPGVTLHQEGIVTWAPSLNWRDFPLKAQLSKHFDLPVIVDNDVNLAALGEMWFGAGHHARNLVLIAIGTGIGAGLIIDGALYRGAHQAAGEIGYVLPGKEALGRRYEGFGALESLASGTGVAERARRILAGEMKPDRLERLSAEDVFDAARRGEAWATTVINETVDYLAIAIAAVSVLLDPDLIVLGGSASTSADLLVEPILRRIEGVLPVTPHLAVSSLGRRAVVLGTITAILHNTIEHYVVRKLS